MANRNVTLQARSRKEKANRKESKKERRNKQKKHRRKDQTSQSTNLTPVLQRDSNNQWLLSKDIVDGFYPTHNHYIGSLRDDTLHNVCAGIQTLTALLSLESDGGMFSRASNHGTYWLALNLLEALSFEIHHRDKLITTSTEPPPTSL